MIPHASLRPRPSSRLEPMESQTLPILSDESGPCCLLVLIGVTKHCTDVSVMTIKTSSCTIDDHQLLHACLLLLAKEVSGNKRGEPPLPMLPSCWCAIEWRREEKGSICFASTPTINSHQPSTRPCTRRSSALGSCTFAATDRIHLARCESFAKDHFGSQPEPQPPQSRSIGLVGPRHPTTAVQPWVHEFEKGHNESRDRGHSDVS